jgi:AraC-like DNA-binding protein
MTMIPRVPGPRSHSLRTGAGWAVGRYESRPSDAVWRSENQIGPSPLIVFPNLAVEIAQAGHPAVVANANVAMLYNGGTPYRRRLIDPRGDRCTWLGLAPSALEAMVAEHDRRYTGAALFRMPRGPVPPAVRLAFHQLVERLADADDLEVHEASLAIASAVIASTAGALGDARPLTPTHRRHRDAVHQMEALVSARFLEPLSLDEVADAAALSPFHGARLFRRHTGRSVHEYREQLRLRAALRLIRRGVPLDEVALTLGFSHHSHFTARFRRAFGVPPSAVRAGS